MSAMRPITATNENVFPEISNAATAPMMPSGITDKTMSVPLNVLNSKINIPHKLSAIGVKPEHVETLADLAIADFAHPNNPKPVTREDFKQLYLEAL